MINSLSYNMHTTKNCNLAGHLTSDGLLTLVVQNSISKVHSYSCYKVSIALDNTYSCAINGDIYKNCSGVIIAPGVPHEGDATNCTVLVNNIDVDCCFGMRAKKMLKGRPYTILTKEHVQILVEKFNEGNAVLGKKENLASKNHILLNALLPEADKDFDLLDVRMISAVNYIKENLEERLKIEDVAKHLFLSGERTRHLFSEQLKISFSQYVLWKKIKAILLKTFNGNTNFANECIRYGFTDQSHFTRIFTGMFGISPAVIMKQCIVIASLIPLTILRGF